VDPAARDVRGDDSVSIRLVGELDAARGDVEPLRVTGLLERLLGVSGLAITGPGPADSPSASSAVAVT